MPDSARITLVRGDITQQQVDAIVNAANSWLLGGGGVDGAIHARGGPAILEECRQIRQTQYPDGMPAGHAVTTTAGELPARRVIHTVGPVWQGGLHGEAEVLASAYRTSLERAREEGPRPSRSRPSARVPTGTPSRRQPPSQSAPSPDMLPATSQPSTRSASSCFPNAITPSTNRHSTGQDNREKGRATLVEEAPATSAFLMWPVAAVPAFARDSDPVSRFPRATGNRSEPQCPGQSSAVQHAA